MKKFKAGLIQSPYDSRDYKFSQLMGAPSNLPEDYEGFEMPYIFDQGQSSMCMACTLNNIRFIQENKESGVNLRFSPMFTYGNREPDQIYEGMIMREALKKAREGVILWDTLPGFSDVKTAYERVNLNKDSLLKRADNYKIDSFYKCSSRDDVKTAIMTTGAVAIGIPVYNCLYRTGADGIVRYNPNVDTQSDGGHAVTLVGWKTIDGVLYWKMLNSWGDTWGKKGYCYLPESYPWMDGAYAIVDAETKLKFEDYKKEFNIQ